MTAPGHLQSPWMSFPVQQFPPLAGNALADVCVVGAGIAGMTTAYPLARKGKRVMVIDDGPIGGGKHRTGAALKLWKIIHDQSPGWFRRRG